MNSKFSKLDYPLIQRDFWSGVGIILKYAQHIVPALHWDTNVTIQINVVEFVKRK